MADGYEADRSEAYFSGRYKPAPLPRRIKPFEQAQKDQTDAKGPANGIMNRPTKSNA